MLSPPSLSHRAVGLTPSVIGYPAALIRRRKMANHTGTVLCVMVASVFGGVIWMKMSWRVGDRGYYWTGSTWQPFAILAIADGMYLLSEGWPPNHVDENWFTKADFDSVQKKKA